MGLLILVIPAVAFLAALIWALVVILSTPSETWDAAGLNQWMWLGVVVFLPLIGTILFLVIGRPRLAEAGSSGAEQVMTQ